MRNRIFALLTALCMITELVCGFAFDGSVLTVSASEPATVTTFIDEKFENTMLGENDLPQGWYLRPMSLS